MVILCLEVFDFDICMSLMLQTIDRLVGGAGDIKLTKDGNTLLKEMVSSSFPQQLYYSCSFC